MWRDILTIIMAAIAVLAWCGITPQRMGQLARRHITTKKAYIVLVGVLTAGAVLSSILKPLYEHKAIDWGIVAGLLYLCFILWQRLVDYYFHPRGPLRMAISLADHFGPILVLALLWIGWDAPIWSKAMPMLLGFSGGILTSLVGKLFAYRSRRRKQSK